MSIFQRLRKIPVLFINKEWYIDKFVNEIVIRSLLKKKIIAKIIIGKRKVLSYYGRCHMTVYRDILTYCRSFKKKYYVLDLKTINGFSNEKERKRFNNGDLWENVDVIIFNPGITYEEGVISLDEVIAYMGGQCQVIRISNLAFKGYYPQSTTRLFQNNRLFYHGDKNLNKIIKSGSIDEQDLSDLIKADFYSKSFVLDFWEKNLQKLTNYERELSCDIGIADYIAKYGKKRILYYSQTHPKNEIMIEIIRRLFVLLEVDINDVDVIEKKRVTSLRIHGEPVYRSVILGLGLPEKAFTEQFFIPGNKEEYDFKTFAIEYCKQGIKANLWNEL